MDGRIYSSLWGEGRQGMEKAFQESLVDTKIITLKAHLHLVPHCLIVLKKSLK